MVACDDLFLGGTLSSTGIAGGTSINSTAIYVRDWSSLLGNPGTSLTPFQVSGLPGSLLVGDALPKSRLLTLNIGITRMGPAVALVEPTEQEQLVANTDNFLTLLANPLGNYLEILLPDTTRRFIHVTALDPASVNQVKTLRSMGVPLFGSPYWSAGGNESTDTISGADTITTAGRVTVYNPVLVFSGDGTFTNSTAGWSITITGSSGAVTVDCGTLGFRTVKQGGVPAEDLITVTSDKWGWFLAGANTVTSSVSVVVTWRDAFA